MNTPSLRRDHPVLHPGLRHGYEADTAVLPTSADHIDTADLYSDIDAAAVARERVFRLTERQHADQRIVLEGWASL